MVEPKKSKNPDSPNSEPDREEIYSDLRHVVSYYRHHAKEYDTDYADSYWQLYDALTWEFLLPYLPVSKDANVLDIGSGTGKWALKLAQMGYHIICGDLSEEMTSIARKKAQNLHLDSVVSFQTLDIRKMPTIPSDHYDLVLALGDVISYALDDHLAVKELYRVCRPGGFCVASVDSKFVYLLNHIKYNHFSVLDEVNQTGISSFFKGHPVKTYLPQELCALFTSHGFVIREIAGKPIFSGALRRKMRETKLTAHFDQILRLECEYGRNPSFLGQAGHLQITVQKPT